MKKLRLILAGLLILGMVGGVSALDGSDSSVAERTDDNEQFSGDYTNFGVVIDPQNNYNSLVVEVSKNVNNFDGTASIKKYSDGENIATISGNFNAGDNLKFNLINLNQNTKYAVVLSGSGTIGRLNNNNVNTYSSNTFDITGGFQDNFGSTLSRYYNFVRVTDQTTETIDFVNNEPPNIDSFSVSPDPFEIGNSLSYSADASDDGSVSNLELTVFKDGSQVYQNSVSSASNTWNDVYTPTSEGDLNARFVATDDAGASTTEWLNRTLSNDAPSVDLTMDSPQWSYDADYSFTIDASDSYPEEDIYCDISRDGGLYEEVYFKEGVNNSYSGSVRSDLGNQSLNVSCEDQDGNTGSASTNYEIKAFEVLDTVFQGSVYETEENVYSVEYKTGEMIDESNVSLDYDADVVEKNGESSTGVSTVQTDFSYRPRLVDSSSEERLFSFGFDFVRETVDGGAVEESESSQSFNQTVNQAFNTQGISFDVDFGETSRTVERHPFDVVLQYGNSDVSETDVDVSAGSSFNGSTKNGFDTEFVSPSVSGSKSFDVSADLFVEFKGEQKARSYSNESFTVDEVVLNENSNGQEVLSFSFYDEESQSSSVTADYQFNFDTSTSAGILDKNFGFSGSGTTTSLYLEPSYADIMVTGPVIYEADTFRNREYRLYNQSLGGGVLNQDLYLIDDTVGEPVYFEVVDQAGDPVDGILQIMRYDASNNDLTTISRRTIDENGQALEYLNIDDARYGYRVIQDGQVVREFDDSIVTCSTVPCEELLQIDEGDLPYYEERRGFLFECGASTNEAGNFTGVECSVDHEDDLMNSATLVVDREKGFTSENVCEETISSQGTVSCEVNETEGSEISYTLKGSTPSYTYTLDTGRFDFTSGGLGQATPVFAVIVFLAVSMAGLRNYGAAILFSVAGAAISYAFGFMAVSFSAIAGLAVVGIFYLLLNKR